ncbi:Mobile element protein [Candidatus Enterovibrio altilux]|uniref:Mobile element protein n=1 Tax=Candidatus Enterovibrio altilux TaxID=1927128 RepID=A0A291BB65_9GAMM|nr:Mobile element protein [Candidatus Enterovibrio luxaltus]
MSYSHYSYIIKRTLTVNVAFKMKTNETIQHLSIDFTALKVYNERE